MSDYTVQLQTLDTEHVGKVIALDGSLEGGERPDFFNRRLQAMQRAPATYIGHVATIDGQFSGYLLARILKGEFGHNRPVVLLEALGVRPEVQGKGVSTRLLDKLSHAARQASCREIQTQVNWHQQALLAYFASMGFLLAPRTVLARPTTALPFADVDEELENLEQGLETSPIIRSLAAGDLGDICRIDRHITGHDRTAYLEQKVAEVLTDSGIRISLVAEVDHMIAGFMMARLDYGEFGRIDSTAVVDTVGVGPEYKGAGIGTDLLAQLLKNLEVLHVEEIRTEVDWENHELNRFLTHCGFAPTQRLALSCPL